MGTTCGGGRMRGPLFDLLFAGAELGAVAPITAVTPRALLVAAAHHCRRALFMLVDPDGEKADHVLVDVRLTLELGDCSSRSIEVERDVMRLAVLGYAVGQRAQAPGFGLHDLTIVVGDDLGGVFRERIDLGLSEVLTREENMLVERHAFRLSFGRSLTRPSGVPLRLS